jgi:hypothetical protein
MGEVRRHSPQLPHTFVEEGGKWSPRARLFIVLGAALGSWMIVVGIVYVLFRLI